MHNARKRATSALRVSNGHDEPSGWLVSNLHSELEKDRLIERLRKATAELEARLEGQYLPSKRPDPKLIRGEGDDEP